MSSSVNNLELLGRALGASLEAIGATPYNVGFFNRIFQKEENEFGENTEAKQDAVEDTDVEKMVEVFLFARPREHSNILPSLGLGVSEMMGVFNAQSEAALDILTKTDTVLNEEDGSPEHICAMEKVLADVLCQNEEELLESIVAKLVELDNDDGDP